MKNKTTIIILSLAAIAVVAYLYFSNNTVNTGGGLAVAGTPFTGTKK